VILISPSFAQTEHAGEPGAAELHEGVEAHNGGGEHGAFPPFDPATWGSQLFWLAITFGALLFLMSRVALPRVAAILEKRSNRLAGDLAAAGRLKEETDAAIAGYEQALAEARQRAHAIGQGARDEAKATIDADRKRTETELQERLAAAEARIGEVKSEALAGVDAIARDAAEAMVEVLIGGAAGKNEIAAAVEAAIAERE
jgi:F-type H+-transporting ATPase subunit b